MTAGRREVRKPLPGSRATGKRGDIKTRCTSYGVPYDDSVTRKAVFLRDEYVCQLCKKYTRVFEKVPHPLAPTVDHVIPLCRGGGHTWDNVQTAHYRCNMAKGY